MRYGKLNEPLVAGDHLIEIRPKSWMKKEPSTGIYMLSVYLKRSKQTEAILEDCKRALLLGGDHSTSLGAIRAHKEHYGDFGVLHIDAHADLRPAYEGFKYSHASVMYNV